ncbi:UvrD-helicase domain-containing protein [Flaviaesturariibacter aridisoli]|uniref:DNA 3'-5' helicase n=1 Tax=Flaviaesturariibacter aridisoli TaxID=2545761 RepID=A0A4R4DZD0_9BACT|nr:UvrD-helicase domain-containing protein [Flaviaesturariibacter aridisoli]TCZ71799.1 ATP-dependent helicase [Flaviaesturariibacter aridisoli]
MQLTAEQNAILAAQGPLKINAVAGSGKTTTLIQYAATRPAGSRILYLAFNRTVRNEAAARFAALGMNGVRVETAHSLAFRQVVARQGYRVRSSGYNTREIAGLLGLQISGEKHGAYILANHIGKFVAHFCNSAEARVTDINYSALVQDDKARTFVSNHYAAIERGTRLLLSQMDKGEIECTHDFYLKKFQLSRPVLPFDYILFDEGQDASPAMLDVFLQQPAIKLIVGDMHQQIYSWRGAVNALEGVDFPAYGLTASFRFGADIARLATQVLSWKGYFGDMPLIDIKGKGTAEGGGTAATIARSNLGLLLAAIRYITDNRSVQHIYFEGNINSYTYAEEGASLYDVLYLYNGQPDKVRDPLLRELGSLEGLEEYIEKTEEAGLATLLEIVREYGNEIFDLLRALKARHVGDAERHKAEMIFSTVHRAKGMEYDTVHLAADFVTETKLERLAAKKETLNRVRTFEEINLLYVALTRARRHLHLPEALLPKDFKASADINVIKTPESALTELQRDIESRNGPYVKKAGAGKRTFLESRLQSKNAHEPWTPETDAELRRMFHQGRSLTDLSGHFGRSKGVILSRLRKLGSLGEEG